MFSDVIKAHGDDLYRFLYGMVCNREDALDLLQETYEAACRHQARWPNQDGWRPWLFTIARNKAVSVLRRRALLRWVPLLASDSPAMSTGDPTSDTIERLTLEQGMRTLSLSERAALVLRLQGFSYEEIAAICGVSPVAVRSRVHRGRENLHRALEGKTKGR
jgi:RNA polymerase sigma factor (sigma-70 family)